MWSGPRAFQSVFSFQVTLGVWLFSVPAIAQISGVSNGISSAQKPAERPGVVAGHVYEADTGRPVNDAAVVLDPEGPVAGRFPEARTGADGSFNFPGVAPGNYTVEAYADEFLSKTYGLDGPQARSKVISISPGQRFEGIDFRLDRAGTISGTIYDEDGNPVQGVMVLAIQPRYDSSGNEVIWGGDGRSTDDDGTFQITRLKPGSYLIRVGGPAGYVADGFRYRETFYPGTDLVQNAQSVQVVAGSDTGGIHMSVRAEQTYKITGTIVDPGAAPQRRYEITVSDPSGGHALMSCNPLRASPETSFTTGGLPAGEYTVTVGAIEPTPVANGCIMSARGYAKVSLRDADGHVDVVIGNGAEIRGKVSIEGQQGSSIPTNRVALVRADGPNLNSLSGLVERDGKFDIRDIPSGAYRFVVRVSLSAAYLSEARCLGTDHTIDPLEIGLNVVVTDCVLMLRADPGAIRGQVLMGDRPAAGMVVVLASEEPALRQLEGYMHTTRTGPGGQFQISGVIPAKYLVFVIPPSANESYYSQQFIDENNGNAQHVSILPRENHVIELTASSPK